MTRKQFTFTVTYFKPSGKFYTEDKFTANIHMNEGGAPHMPHVVAKVRGWRDEGSPGSLPGLSGGGWAGYILVDCEEGYPCLIIPREE